MKQLLTFLLAVTLLAACSSPTSLFKQGRMDPAITKALQKVRKGKAKDKHILVLEKAFNVANQRDYAELQSILGDNDDAKWGTVNRISKSIQDRQELVKAYLPIRIKSEHRNVRLKLYPVQDLVVQSKEKAAAYYYDMGVQAIALAEKGDKREAREAYYYFDAIKKYYNQYKDENQQMKKAHALGTSHVVIGLDNRTTAFLPMGFKDEVLRMYPSDLNSFWAKFDLNPQNRTYDYKVIIRLSHVDVSPERVREGQFVEEKEIEDGFDYALDANGNVMKDSLGNDVKITRYTTIRANVFTSEQHKEALIRASVDIQDLRTKRTLMSRPVTGEFVFTNQAMRFDGDKRALTEQTKRMIGNRPVPFPTDEAMLLSVAEALSGKIKDEICDQIKLFEEM